MDSRLSHGATVALSDDGPNPVTFEDKVRTGKLTCTSAQEYSGEHRNRTPDWAAATRLVRLQRPSTEAYWNLELQVAPVNAATGESLLLVESGRADDPACDSLERARVRSINGHMIGSHELDTVQKVVKRLAQEVDVLLELEWSDGEED
jgi:hypothetical protein